MSEIDAFLPLPHLPYHVLLVLSEQDAMHGWAIIKRIEEISGGKTCPSSGSLYLAMGRLQERDLLVLRDSPPDEQDGRRRYYGLTSLGRRVLAAESERLAGLVEIARSSGALPDE